MDVFKPRELLDETLDSTEETAAFQVASVLDMLHRAICDTFRDLEHDKHWYTGDISRIFENLDTERLNFMKFGDRVTATRKNWESALNTAHTLLFESGLM